MIVEKCTHCKRKRITIQCLTCKHMFCSGCIQIEEHNCEKIDEKIKNQLDVLSKKNQKLITVKLGNK